MFKVGDRVRLKNDHHLTHGVGTIVHYNDIRNTWTVSLGDYGTIKYSATDMPFELIPDVEHVTKIEPTSCKESNMFKIGDKVRVKEKYNQHTGVGVGIIETKIGLGEWLVYFQSCSGVITLLEETMELVPVVNPTKEERVPAAWVITKLASDGTVTRDIIYNTDFLVTVTPLYK